LILTSASWDLAISTKTLPAGWTISNNFKIVAPSLEIVTLPLKIKINRIYWIVKIKLILNNLWIFLLKKKYFIHQPLESTISLSIPLGPRVVLIVSAIAIQALMFDKSWPLPWEVSVPSLKRIICGC